MEILQEQCHRHVGENDDLERGGAVGLHLGQYFGSHRRESRIDVGRMAVVSAKSRSRVLAVKTLVFELILTGFCRGVSYLGDRCCCCKAAWTAEAAVFLLRRLAGTRGLMLGIEKIERQSFKLQLSPKITSDVREKGFLFVLPSKNNQNKRPARPDVVLKIAQQD